MKKVLITGKNSYIGTAIFNYLERDKNYSVEILDTKNMTPKEYQFKNVDVVINVAGIAHIKENSNNESLYFAINRDLVLSIAKCAKNAGVRHFINLSSMSVYGKNTGIINYDTVENPKTAYGKSKCEADYKIYELMDETFFVTCIRPPMVYGPNCKGNFQKLVKIIEYSPLFPVVNNQRSMIYIDNLTYFVKYVMDNNLFGTYHPQNNELVNTTEMASIIASELGKKIHLSKALGILVKMLEPRFSIIQKAFGSLVYEYDNNIRFIGCENNESFRKSIKR